MGKAIKIIFDAKKSIEVEKNYIIDNFLSKENNIGYSIVRSHLDGKHPFMKNIRSNRTYFLLKGNAQFHVENEIIDLTEGEMLVIPKNTKYAFKGHFDSLLVDCPAFDSADDIIYEEQIKE